MELWNNSRILQKSRCAPGKKNPVKKKYPVSLLLLPNA